MKPLSSITQSGTSFRGEPSHLQARRPHPVIDSHYHVHDSELQRSHCALRLATPSFRELSRTFLGAEMKREYFSEAFFFAIIVGVSVWPIVTMMQAWAELAL